MGEAPFLFCQHNPRNPRPFFTPKSDLTHQNYVKILPPLSICTQHKNPPQLIQKTAENRSEGGGKMQKSSWIFWLLLAVVPVGCGNGDCHDGDDAIAEQDADEEEIDLIPERPPGSDTDESIAPEPLITQPLPPAPEVIRPFQLRDSYTLNAHTCAGAIQEFELSNEGD